ncbi:CHAT domain-containing protein [Spirosoma endbachense]|uniref:CHAT domain-containing protein n=1 Tax=Spirosoma endbachense TaxID=2666025 RepID=A0A6P1VTT2_9BACT|nr:CHAT domain-containing protein [Spirosoma endbachense]QHV95019.1 CHAT domain-containing protein [Spirosoma endbachense]
MSCFRLYLLVSVGLTIGLTNSVDGQCPSKNQFYRSLQTISAQTDLARQASSFQKWKEQWEHCGYPADSTYVNGLLELGLAQFNQNELATAIQNTEKAIQLCKSHQSVMSADQLAKGFYRLGLILSFQGKPKEAQEALNQSIREGSKVPTAAKWVGNAYLYLAFGYNAAGDYQQAVSTAERAEIVAQKTHDKLLLAKLVQEKAKALTRLANYVAARKAAELSINLVQNDKSLQAAVATGYRLLGSIAEGQGQIAEALQYERRAFEVSRDSKDPYAPNYAVTLGMHYYKQQKYEQAAPYFRYSIDHNTSPYNKAQSLDNLGAVYWKQKQFIPALRYYQTGLRTMPIGFMDSRIEKSPSLEIIRRAARKQYLLTIIQDKADTWLDFAKATNNNRQRLQFALDTYNVADQIIDFMRWEQTGQQSKLYWRQKTRGMYQRAIETCYLLGDTEQAFRFLEKSRAVMLADKLNELGAQQQLSTQQAADEQRLRQTVGEQQNKLAGLSPDSASYAAVRDVLLVKQDSLEAFLKQLEATNPAYFRYKYDNTTSALADLQRYLKKQSGSLVTYFVGDSALYVMGVTGDSVTFQQQSAGAYNQILSQFAPLLNSPEAMNKQANVSRFLTLGNGLYQQLLAPLKLPKGRVIVSPDGFFIPFDALSRSADHPDYAVNEYAFSYAYSASLLLKNGIIQKPVPSFQKAGFLGVAPVDFAPRLSQVMLSGSDIALIAIASRFDSPMLLTHKAATRGAFQRQVSAYPVVLLFTHAAADSTSQEPMLYFADSTLRLSELGDGALPNAQLVVLAACKTGIGANQQGEGVFSLARGFSALGVPSVLTTLWSVQNEATYQLTSLFYKYLDEGLPKDIALQRAKQEWLTKAEGVNQLPNYWAGLIVIGDTEPLSRTNYWLWIAGGLLVLLSGFAAWWFWRKRQVKPVVSFPRSA